MKVIKVYDLVLFFFACFVVMGSIGTDSVGAPSPSFGEVKTFFQTNEMYDPRIGIAADGVIVHSGHGPTWEATYESWAKRGAPVGRMFFADSDDLGDYWTGKWDGQEHKEDVEQDFQKNPVLCGTRPYMLPTEGWIRYLEEKAEKGLNAGAAAIMPEEPLGHCQSGYEKSFLPLWESYYKVPWQGAEESPEAWYRTGQLKEDLYLQLEERLLAKTRQKAAEQKREVSFIVPIHSLYSNAASRLVAPLGVSQTMAGADGYVGQIWTGPIRWCLGQYESPRESFFGSAYALYDYFCQLTAALDKKLWLLVDPVEDDVNQSWEDYRQWYKHSVAAMLLMSEVDRYEVMPWPDRIFLPGFMKGPDGRSPVEFRKIVLSVTQMLQEIPAGGRWFRSGGEEIAGQSRIGVAVADSLMWQKHEYPVLQEMYGMLLPLLERGIPVSSCLMERCNQPDYMKRFSVIVLSYEAWKPTASWMHESLLQWVKQGGSLIILAHEADAWDRIDSMWWRQAGRESALEDLLAVLGRQRGDSSWPAGSGHVFYSAVSPRQFADPVQSERVYLPLLKEAFQKRNSEPLRTPGYFYMKRGPFVIVHAETRDVSVPGRMIDMFDPDLGMVENVVLTPGESGMYKDMADWINGKKGAAGVVHATHRLISERFREGVLEFVIRGPAQTPGVVRVWTGGATVKAVIAKNSDGAEIPVQIYDEKHPVRLEFENCPDGITVSVRLAK